MAIKPEIRKTILIGLGGAGQQIVLRTKRFFIDTYGVLPPSVRLLCLDTDNEELSLRTGAGDRECRIDPQEFVHLSVSNPAEFITHSDAIRRWYAHPVPAGAINRGAGAVRQTGRLALFFHINEVVRRLDTMLAELNDLQLVTRMERAKEELGANTNFTLSPRETEVCVCGSLAGGTGSGTFIDLGILLRDKCPNALLHGYFLLSWVYRNKAFAHRVRQNVYAALSELDNLQSIKYGDKQFVPYQVRYAAREVHVDKWPYDLFHLIDGRNEAGENIDNVVALCETIANALFLSVSSMAFPIASVVDNLLAHISVASPRVWGGRCARYSSLGVSSLHYPAVELHRLVAAINALQLCQAAISEVTAGKDKRPEMAAVAQTIREDVGKFVNQLGLNRASVRAQLCPNQSPVSLTIETFEIADATFPSLVQAKFDGESRLLRQDLEAGFEGSGRVFVDGVVDSLDHRLRELTRDATLRSAEKRAWCCDLIDVIKGLRDETAQALVAADQRADQLRQNADKLLGIATQSRYLPFLGGSRKRATVLWAEDASRLLTEVKASINLRHEQTLYETFLELLEKAAAVAVPKPSDIMTVLMKAESRLRARVAEERKTMDILRKQPNRVLLGYGTVVIIPGADNAKELEDVLISYESFTADQGIHNPEDYLARSDAGGTGLATLFYDHCLNQLSHLRSVRVDHALDVLARGSDNPDQYLKKQFDHLFRLSAELWTLDRGRITPEQAGQIDKIVNIGFYDHEAELPRYRKITDDAKARFHIRSDLSFSSTGDPYNIWLLNYAAAIPAYYVSDLREARQQYLEEISPTYHIDTYLEMNVPDLFPVDEIDNRLLRLLAMAIVPGVDVIRDEKLDKGHKFTLDHADIRTRNYGEAKVWLLFRDMFDDIKGDYDRTRTDNLYDILSRLVREKVKEMGRAELRSAIETHIGKVRHKLANKDFSKLISARLTYAEIRALELFLSNPPLGYGMDMDRYVSGAAD
ncbi:MAG: tubulin-like doman-containing protein [Gammaproteobacteria bacterium]